MTASVEQTATTTTTTPQGEVLITAFRQQAATMKNWKPASVPSNRDRLELYAWHKQALSGDAPASLGQTSSATLTAAETAKVNVWRSKRGVDSAVAMRHYLQEAERQIRVYGGSASIPNAANAAAPHTSHSQQSLLEPESTAHRDADTSARSSASHAQNSAASRGLAALPLLCAAAAEPRPAYLRRLQTTPPSAAWWRRQEPLIASPGHVTALPEHILLGMASMVEHVSLWVNRLSKQNSHTTGSSNSGTSATLATATSASSKTSTTSNSTSRSQSIIAAVIQSSLWPLHNALLAVWMGWIVIWAVILSAWDLTRTLLLGSRRTGQSLQSTWCDDVVFAAQSVRALTETHQPLSARVVGLVLQPLSILVQLVQTLTGPNDQQNLVGRSGLYVALVILSLWYWLVILPWFLSVVVLGSALVLGNCFALIEWAAHI